jgi:signal transduction histidine kinase
VPLTYGEAMPALTLPRWPGRVPEPVIDAGLAAATAVVMVVAISVGRESQARTPGVLGYGLGLTVAVLLLARRRWPLAVLVTSALVLGIYHAFNFPPTTLALPLSVALYTAAVAGHARAAAVVGAVVAGFMVGARTLIEPEPLLRVVDDAVREVALAAAAILLGLAVRSRRAWMAEVQERLRRAELDREREARRRVAEERLRIAQELHDVMAHTITVVTVQAGVATDLLEGVDGCPPEARAALATIRAASREAVGELNATVGVLRDSQDGHAPRAPAPGLGQVDELVRAAAGAGLRVELAVAGTARSLPAVVDLTAYRIVQESLTNVLRHARATTATVAIRYEPDEVVLEVADDGPSPDGDTARAGGHREGAGGTRAGPGGGGPGPGPASGHGLVGMQERATAVGGRLEAGPGPAPDGGFRVVAHLPTRGAPA